MTIRKFVIVVLLDLISGERSGGGLVSKFHSGILPWRNPGIEVEECPGARDLRSAAVKVPVSPFG
jgi:hypothetical protein